jgi:hypothetical protein
MNRISGKNALRWLPDEKNYLQCALILPEEYRHSKNLTKIETFSDKSRGHYFKMERLDDFDDDSMQLIRKAYQVGQQKFMKKKE